MAQYDYAQLEQLWIDAGGPRSLAPLMAAIALAESSGNSDAKNPSGASGLWQILGNPFPGDPFNAQTNARMAVAKYHEQGLTAWATYSSGAYKRFMRGNVPPAGGGPAQATLTAKQGGSGSGGGGGFWSNWQTIFGLPIGFIAGTASSVADVGTALGQINNDLATLMSWVAWLFVPSHWIRIICFALGVPLVGVGIVTLTRTGRPYTATVTLPGAGSQTVPAAGGQLAPALGIAEVTMGAILLFIAFHNLPENVQTFPQLLSHVQQGVGTAAASKVGPGKGIPPGGLA